jgi:hypothetical protein
MMTAFWVLFLIAVAVVGAALFWYLMIPIILIGLLILAWGHCGGEHGRRVGQTTDSNSSQSAHSASGHIRQI